MGTCGMIEKYTHCRVSSCSDRFAEAASTHINIRVSRSKGSSSIVAPPGAIQTAGQLITYRHVVKIANADSQVLSYFRVLLT